MSEKKRICIDKKRVDFLDIDTFVYLSSFFASAEVVISLLLTCKQVRGYLLKGAEVCKNVEFVCGVYYKELKKESKRTEFIRKKLIREKGEDEDEMEEIEFWTSYVFTAMYPYVKKLRFSNIDFIDRLRVIDIISKFPLLVSLRVCESHVSFWKKISEARRNDTLKEILIEFDLDSDGLPPMMYIRKVKDSMPNLERFHATNCEFIVSDSNDSYCGCPFKGLKKLKALVLRNINGTGEWYVPSVSLSMNRRFYPSSLLDLPALETLDVRKTTWFIDMLVEDLESEEEGPAVKEKLKSLKSILVCCSNPIDVDKICTDLKKERGLYYCPKCEQKCKKCHKQIFDQSGSARCNGCEEFTCKKCRKGICDCCKEVVCCESCFNDAEKMAGFKKLECSNDGSWTKIEMVNAVCPNTDWKWKRGTNGELLEEYSIRDYFLCGGCQPLKDREDLACCCCGHKGLTSCYSCLLRCDGCDGRGMLCVTCSSARLNCKSGAYEELYHDMEDGYGKFCYSCQDNIALIEKIEKEEGKEEAKNSSECGTCKDTFCKECRKPCIHCGTTVCEDCAFFCSGSPECSLECSLEWKPGSLECVWCVGDKYFECMGKKCKNSTHYGYQALSVSSRPVEESHKWHLECKDAGMKECGKCKEYMCIECFGDARCKICQKFSLPCSGCCQKQVKCVECNFPICDNCKEISVFKSKPDLSVNVCKECAYWAPPKQ